MKDKKETFAEMMATATYHYDLRSVFDDLLTMSLCALTQNIYTGKSYYEELYLETIKKYKTSDFRFQFPKLFAQLVMEMDERLSDHMGNDVLGEYFEQHLSRKNSGQFFTPWYICLFMSECLAGNAKEKTEPIRVLDPSCGSGRMLLAGTRSFGRQHEFYGIDVDHTCVKMAAINLFLHRVFNAEVMWSNALAPDDFHLGYATSKYPLGIFRIEDKEKSKLWHLHQNTFKKKEPESDHPTFREDSKPFGNGSQITLF